MNWKLLAALLVLSGRLWAQPDPHIAALLRQVAPDSLRKTVAEVAGVTPVWIAGQSQTIVCRQYNTPGNELAFQYLKDRLTRYGYAVDSQVFGGTGKNLLGVLPGRDTTGFVLIGAHYDNVGYPTAQGADDNGSGVAAVLECARLCRPVAAGRTLVFAFWDEEETGAIGSTAYVQRIVGRAEPLVGYINLDMAGWDGNKDSVAEVHVRASGQSTDWAARVLTLNADYAIGLQLQTILPGIAATDVGPFWQAGQTAIGIGEDYDGDAYPCKHAPTDTLENIDFAYLAKQTRLVLAAGLQFSQVQSVSVPSVMPEPMGYAAGPNPFSTVLEVQVPKELPRPAFVVVTDVVGRVQYRSSAAAGAVRVDTRDWPAGTYLLTVVADGAPLFASRLVRLAE